LESVFWIFTAKNTHRTNLYAKCQDIPAAFCYTEAEGGICMELKTCKKESFSVIGRLGSTKDGEGFIQHLWQEANSRFGEVSHLAKRDDSGNFSGFWGLMSDEGMNFRPWEDNFSRGLYLAGVEVEDTAQAPEGWAKWTSPAYEYLVAEAGPQAFSQTLEYIKENGMELIGAVYDFTDPTTGENYQYFPIRRL